MRAGFCAAGMKTFLMRVWSKISAKITGHPSPAVGARGFLLQCVVAILAPWTFVIGADSGESLHFTNAVLFTPARTNTENRIFRFAPLLVFETAATNLSGRSPRDKFGAVETKDGSPRINPKKPTVYAHSHALAINGQPCERFSYVWWRPPLGFNSPMFAQGLRITATPGGQPLVFEILDTSTNSRRIVVAQSLEAAAWQEFRGLLPGRRFAVEQLNGDASAEVVSRVIDDGPLELGPVVYLRGGGGGVGTVICRCMPAQTRSIAATGYYDLVEWTGETNGLLEQAHQQSRIPPLGWSSQMTNDPGLERLLRLPGRLPGSPGGP